MVLKIQWKIGLDYILSAWRTHSSTQKKGNVHTTEESTEEEEKKKIIECFPEKKKISFMSFTDIESILGLKIPQNIKETE